MNLNQLRFVMAVAETASFSRAAEQCCVTQPTLSNAVSQLEDELGGRLFQRTTRAVSITNFGRELLPLINAVLEAQGELLNAAKLFHAPKHKLVRIGMSPLVDVGRINELLAPYKSENPDVEFFFKQCFLDDIDTRLGDVSIDLAITPARKLGEYVAIHELYCEPLYYLPKESSGVVPVPPGPCSLAINGDVPIILTSGCGLSDTIIELFKHEGLPLSPYPGQALSYQVVEEWAGMGIAASILPVSKISAGNKTSRPIRLGNGMGASVVYQAAWNRNETKPAHIDKLLQYIRSAVMMNEYPHAEIASRPS